MKALAQTLRAQRASLVVDPIHAEYAPVSAYAKQIAAIKEAPFDVVTIPKGSAAYSMGYRFVSIPHTELDYYLANGATKTTGAAP